MVNHIQLTKQTLIERINKCRNSSGGLSATRLKADKSLYGDLQTFTNFLSDIASYSERIFCILNDITTLQTCSITGKPLRWSPNTKQYRQSESEHYASIRGKQNKPLSNSLKSKYDNLRVLLHTKFTSGQFQKLTVAEILANAIINQNNPRSTPATVIKNLELFCNILDKTQFIPFDTCNCKWGERIYCLKNGITSPILTFNGDIAPYVNSQYGYAEYREDVSSAKHHEIVSHLNSKGFKVLTELTTKTKYITVKCNKCNTEHEQFIRCGYWKDPYCEGCYGATGRSKLEDNTIDFMSEFVANLKIEKNWLIPGSRKEIDIYLPELNIGFEICGTLWHSYGTKYPNTAKNEKERKHHISNKVDLANKNGITLYTIFEHEWETNHDKIKHMILSKLGKYNERLYARKCDIREIDKFTKRDFLNDYHLQNNDNSQRYFGLFDKDRLVSVMTFGTRKITRADAELEMIRYCSLPGVQIIGGASKLLKNAMITLGVTTVKTYCDRRFSNGDFYKSIGFELIRTSKPNFWFTKDCKKLLHRMSFQRHKIVNETNKHMKTDDIIYSLGYRKLYDAGNYVFKTTHVDYK